MVADLMFELTLRKTQLKPAQARKSIQEKWPSSIIEICNILQDENRILFSMSGFGISHSYLEVGYELPMFLEEVPELHRRLRRPGFKYQFEIWAQGNEMFFEFTESEQNQIRVRCRYLEDAGKNLHDEILDRSLLRKMLQEFVRNFLAVVDENFANEDLRLLRNVIDS